ncbi:MAG: RsmD family RNA methyltransferase [Chloroflexota bacterium]|nr:RsmD family RNA methyltransferase [Chloroflexota bacterium]
MTADPVEQPPIVLSYRQARGLLDAREERRETAAVSLDLGLTVTEVTLTPYRILLADGRWLSWEGVGDIAEDEAGCYLVEDDGRTGKIQRFSELTNRHYSLFPTSGAPTILIAGFSMHRIKGTDPWQDTLAKVRQVAPVRGRVLDTSTGLGYTAIEAARTAAEVVTIELDPTTLTIARLNPWSRDLFASPKIRQIVGDSYEEVQGLDDGSFARIIHDPPIFSLAGELYSGAFYRQLYRVLARNGRLFHYIGSLESKQGHGVARGVIRRLGEAGFTRVERRPEAFGVVAYKGR